MDQIVPRVLHFDRCELDLTRGCVRIGQRQIDLAPKPFEVLRHLAENAGRLVSKQELLEAVWPNVAVTDDSLVQCIRELRSKLGDEQRQLIKTVPRRGYLLDTNVTAPLAAWHDRATPSLIQWTVAPALNSAGNAPQSSNQSRWRLWGAAAAALLLAGILAVSPLTSRMAQAVQQLATRAASIMEWSQSSSPSELFTESDAKRVAALAERKQLPLPVFRIGKTGADVPDSARRFVGVWVSDKGWIGSNRQLMVIVAHVDADGTAAGYVVNGPPQPKSRVQSPAHFAPFKGRIADGTLSFVDRRTEFWASHASEAQLQISVRFPEGVAGWVTLDPVWRLVEAEHATLASTHAP